MFSLQGRTALITGATRGIGQPLAIALAEAGSDVVLVQRDESNQATKQAIERLGRKATIYVADLASATDVGGLTKRVLDDGHDIGSYSRLAPCNVADRDQIFWSTAAESSADILLMSSPILTGMRLVSRKKKKFDALLNFK